MYEYLQYMGQGKLERKRCHFFFDVWHCLTDVNSYIAKLWQPFDVRLTVTLTMFYVRGRFGIRFRVHSVGTKHYPY